MSRNNRVLIEENGKAVVLLPDGGRYLLPEPDEDALRALESQGIAQFHASAQDTSCVGFRLWLMWRSSKLTASKRLELRVSLSEGILPIFLEADGSGGWQHREGGPLWHFTGFEERDEPVSN